MLTTLPVTPLKERSETSLHAAQYCEIAPLAQSLAFAWRSVLRLPKQETQRTLARRFIPSPPQHPLAGREAAQHTNVPATPLLLPH